VRPLQENSGLARFYPRSSAFICGQYGVWFRGGPEEKRIWPQMNADNAEVLRSAA